MKVRFLAVTILAAVALGAPQAGAQEVKITDKARNHFRAGVNLLNDPDGARYEEAYVQFKTAYAESPSWKILGNLGICAMKLERDGEAIEAISGYLKGGGADLDPDERAQMERDLQTLKAGVVFITLQSDPPGAVVVDTRTPSRGSPVTNRYELKDEPLKIGVRPGAHRFSATLSGYQESTWTVTATAGGTLDHTFKMEEPTPEAPAVTPPPPTATPTADPTSTAPVAMERPIPTGVFIGLAATGALAVGAGVTGFLALGKKSDFDDANDGTDPDGAQEIADSGKTLNLITDVLIGGAVVAGAVTAVLYLNRPEVPADAETALRVAPAIGPSGGGLSVSGAF